MDSTTTKHATVRHYIEQRIRDELSPHERLPAERMIAEDLQVNRVTVRRALEELERDGLIYRVQGSGTFVSEGRIRKSTEFTSFSEDMRSRGFEPGSMDETFTIEPAGMATGYALGVSPASPVVRLRRTRTADGRAICLEDSALPESLVPGLADGLGGLSLYTVLKDRYAIRVVRADQTIHAVVLNPAQAHALEVPEFSPALRVTRISRDAQGRPVEFAESLYRADLYAFELSVSRAPGRGQ